MALPISEFNHLTRRFTSTDWPRFVLNGLVHANEVLGADAFNVNDWQVIGEYVYDDEGGRHQAFYSPVRDVTVLGVSIKAHERIQVEQSLKYSEDGMTKLWTAAGVIETERWMVDGDEYGKLIPNLFLLYLCPTLENGGAFAFHAESTNEQHFPTFW